MVSMAYNGNVTQGTMMAKQPKPHRQLTCSRNASAALDPANAVIMYGEDVNANARPRFFSDVESAASTSTEYVIPAKPME
jgi:hypothetical protein